MAHESITVGASVAAYTHAKVVGNLVFTSGVTSHDLTTGEVRGESIEEQTEYSLQLLSTILEAAGCTLADCVRVNVFLDDINADYAGFDATYKRIVPQPYPPRATVGSTLPGYLIEIVAIAAKPE